MNPMRKGFRFGGETPAGINHAGPTVLYVGLDLSRKRLDWHPAGSELIGEGGARPIGTALPAQCTRSTNVLTRPART
jgi:hypothetical protein